MKRIILQKYQHLILLFTTGFIFICSPALAATGNAVKSANTTVQLVSEELMINPGKKFTVALKLNMDPEWHVYWRNAGDSGLPVKIIWNLPEGFRAGEIQWPYPERVDIDPLTSYGYHGEVVLLVDITPPANLINGQQINLSAKIQFLACKIECVGGTASLSLPFQVRNQNSLLDPNYTQLFENTRSKIPQANVYKKTYFLELENEVVLEILADIDFVQFFPYEEKIIEYADKQDATQTDGGVVVNIQKSTLRQNPIETFSGVLLVKNRHRDQANRPFIPYEVIFTPNQPFIAKQSEVGMTLLSAIVFAFLGGLILNLMPCVLPVLSIKILQLMDHSKEEKGKHLINGLLYALGILVTFWILVAGMLLLQSAGKHIGWGFQFQSPLFVMAMGVLFFVMSLNLFGLFEVGTSLTRVNTTRSAFLNGIVATIVATPCTAPFMGSALGYGLTQPPVVSFSIFTSLGIGLAFPFVVLSIFPSLLRFLPKPGRWMGALKSFFGCLFLLTMTWLGWVLWLQKGPKVILMMILGLTLIFAACYIYGRVYQRQRNKSDLFISILLVLTGVFVCVVGVQTIQRIGESQNKESIEGIKWIPYSKAKISELSNSNKPIFIDFTASWCLSCQVNDRVTLSKSVVIDKFKELNIIPLKADWTNYDEEITEALAGYGRNSIPLYVYYPQGLSSDPIILPEIITPKIILNTIDK